jgi:WhiB family transcriptional regulator, redox-sensing transcriptional regulator
MTLTWIRDTDWDEQNWREKAICRSSNAELFFPIGTTGHALEIVEAAKEVCSQCEVRKECLQFSFDTNQESGIWGGYSETERRLLKKSELPQYA